MLKALWMTPAVLLLAASSSFAQASGASRLGWDQPNATASDAQAYTYKLYADGAATGTVLSGVTCAGSAPVKCSAPFPPFTPGNHTLMISASNAAGEGVKSVPFAFAFVVVPSQPVSLRIE